MINHKDLPSAKAPQPQKVEKMFDAISGNYDSFNRWASLGTDKLWRKELIRQVFAQVSCGTIVDLGSGTGDLILDSLAFLRNKNRQNDYHFVGLDLSKAMLEQAQIKHQRSDFSSQKVLWVQGDVSSMTFKSQTVDAFISAFVLRNIKKIIYNTLQEVYRSLKSGGRVYLLDMYVPQNLLLKILHSIYLKLVLPLTGKIILGSAWPENYLKETIENFGQPEEFSQLLIQAGFKEVSYKKLFGGIAVLHSACK